MSTIYLLEAEHWNVPGRVVHAYNTPQSAQSKAHEIVSLMLEESSLDPSGDWQADLVRVQDVHGAQYCYVDVTPLNVNP